MSETLHCNHCGKDVTYHTELKSNQNTAWCNECGGYLKNIPYDKPKFYVGKYAGKEIETIDDLNYLKWAVEKMRNLKGRTKDAINQRIAQLENEAR